MLEIEFPIIILNYKNYSQTIGEKGLELTKIAEEVSLELGANIAVCPQTADIRMISNAVEIPVLSQHVDSNNPGSFTGNNLLETIVESGAIGTLVNHSEHRLILSDIEKIVKKSKEHNFFTCICSNNLQTSKSAAVMSPDAVAMEPPELIGGDISVTTKPDLVSKTISAIQDANPFARPLVGAGVSKANDVTEALKLGAQGVLLASGFVKAKNPKKALEEMAIALIDVK
ncbi:MAG: triose-phosphate isomerase [Candidatus Heimdallarchaeota archaeon]|nr:triose-phosphate isomerase [Candidatus Heimdallarchaeota archaeon]